MSKNILSNVNAYAACWMRGRQQLQTNDGRRRELQGTMRQGHGTL